MNIFLYTYNITLLLNQDYANVLGGPAGGALAFPTIKQLLGEAEAEVTLSALRNSARTRAQTIVNRGAWTSVDGLETVFRAQADLINGTGTALIF